MGVSLSKKDAQGKDGPEGKQEISGWWSVLSTEDRASWVPAGHSDPPHHGESLHRTEI